MMQTMLVPATLAVLLLALATPPPFTVDTPTPAPAAAVPLPEIGRTRSNSRACTAYRDLVVPSLSAVLNADARFVKAREHIATYADHLDDKYASAALKTRGLDEIDRDGLAMLKETLVLNRALGDSRLNNANDPQIQAERATLEQLYEAQSARAWTLVNFSRAAKYGNLRNLGSRDPSTGVGMSASAQDADAGPSPAPNARPTAENAFPQLSGIPIDDKRALEGWGTNLGDQVRTAEVGVAPTLVSLSRGCR